MKEFLEFCESLGIQIRTIHTSGHADRSALKAIIAHVQPDEIIPVHTLDPKSLKKYDNHSRKNPSIKWILFLHATVLSSSYAIVVSNIMEAGTKVKKNLIEYLLKEKAKHKGKWLTWDAVNEYRRRAQNLKKSSGEITRI